MSTVSGKNTHPLTACVPAGENRDPVGHLIIDPVGDREFRFVQMRGGQTASQGQPVFAYKLSADEDNLAHVTVDGASTPGKNPDRDLFGIFVGQSTCASGQFGYVMTRGRLGQFKRGLYSGSVFALVSAAVANQDLLAVSEALSIHKWFAQASVWDATSAGEGQSQHARISLRAFSTDIGDKLTRGDFRSPLLFGGLQPAPDSTG